MVWATHLAGAAARSPAPASFRVGFAKEPLDPRPWELRGGGFHLGGYGIFPTRASRGPLRLPDGSPEHLYVRAMAIRGRGGAALLLAELENQGTFAAYKQCACGLWDVRREVAAKRNVPIASIVVGSDHSHSGPDLIGLWGGVPESYLHYVHDQAVRALEEADARARPARLSVGTATPRAAGAAMVHSQFGADPITGHDDGAVDTQLRVLQAVTPAGRPLGTLVNYAAHATVTSAANVAYSADWPGWVARGVEQALHEPVAVTMVADVGRSQPPRPQTDAACGRPGHVSCDVDRLATYERDFVPFVRAAVSAASAVTSDVVASHEVLTREVGANAALLAASASPADNGFGAYRADTPPWLAGAVVGTVVSAHRIGDVLLTANPGEAYPDIRTTVSSAVARHGPVFTFGLANDQLGYLIAPAAEYPWIVASHPGNDNALFNVSATYGDHVACAQISSATAIGFTAAAPAGCAALAAGDGVVSP